MMIKYYISRPFQTAIQLMKCRLLILIALTSLISKTSSFGQQGRERIDSLVRILKTLPEDTHRVTILNTLSFNSSTIDPDGGILYAKEARFLAEKFGIEKARAEAYSNLGLNLTSKADYSGALENHFKALSIHERMGNKLNAAVCCSNIGVVYNNQNNLEKALEYYEKALKVFRELKYEQGISTTLGNLGLLHMARKENEKALECFLESYTFAESKRDTGSMAVCIGNMGNVYLAQNNLLKALEFDLRALQYNKQIGDLVGTGIGLGNVGEVYFRIATDTVSGLLDSVFGGNKKAALDSSAENLRNSLAVFKKIGFLNGIQEVHKYLINVYEEQGDYKSALEEARAHLVIKDSIFNEENNNRIAEIEARRMKELNQKELEIQNLRIQKAEKDKYLLLAAVIFLIILSLVMYNRFRIKKKSNQQLEETLVHLKATQQQLVEQEKLASLGALAAGVAHEIQNPLNFVNNFSELSNELIDDFIASDNEKEKTQIAGDLKENLQKIHQHGKRADAIVKNMLMHSRTESGTRQLTDLNKLCEESLGFSFHAIQAKYKGFSCDIEKKFSPNLEQIAVVPGDISRVILNMLNNAFYSMYQKKLNDTSGDYRPRLVLSTFRGPDRIVITITDNGLGIPAPIVQKLFEPFFTTKPANEGTGLGLSISYDIIKAHGGKIRVKSDEETSFVIELYV